MTATFSSDAHDIDASTKRVVLLRAARFTVLVRETTAAVRGKIKRT